MIAEDLIRQGLLDIKSFYKTMDLAGNEDYTDSVMTVYKVLSSFTLGSDCLDNSDLPGRPFISVLRWLSIVVCRSCYHWDLAVNRWVSFQLLGKPVLVEVFSTTCYAKTCAFTQIPKRPF